MEETDKKKSLIKKVLSSGTGSLFGLVLGLIIGGFTVWSVTNDFVEKAVVKAEKQFDKLLEEEKKKYDGKIEDITTLKNGLEETLTETRLVVDSLNFTIHSRNKQLDRLKRKYYEQISYIDDMSHNELSDFFANRYGY